MPLNLGMQGLTMLFVTNSAGNKSTSLPSHKELLGAAVFTFNAEGGHTHMQSYKEQKAS